MNRLLLFCVAAFLGAVLFISCKKELSFESPNSLPDAHGSLQDNSGNCYISTVKGRYFTGVTPNDSDYVVMQVNVTSLGKYKIVTDTVNGFSFADSGSFRSTGVQTIQLKASGVPVIAQTASFFVSFDSTICSFNVLVNDSTGSGQSVNDSDSAWQFTEAGRTYHGYIDTAFYFDTTVNGQLFRVATIQGSTAATGDSVLLMSIVFNGGAIIPGNYNTNSSAFLQFYQTYPYPSTKLDTLYSAVPYVPTVNTTIKVAAFDANTRVIQGSFSGTAINKGGSVVNLTGGKVQAKLN